MLLLFPLWDNSRAHVCWSVIAKWEILLKNASVRPCKGVLLCVCVCARFEINENTTRWSQSCVDNWFNYTSSQWKRPSSQLLPLVRARVLRQPFPLAQLPCWAYLNSHTHSPACAPQPAGALCFLNEARSLYVCKKAFRRQNRLHGVP